MCWNHNLQIDLFFSKIVSIIEKKKSYYTIYRIFLEVQLSCNEFQCIYEFEH